MKQQIKNYKQLKEKMFEKVKGNVCTGDNIIVGFSGGADSVSLLFLLNQLKNDVDYNLTAVHINHNLRGQESLRDEKFCRDFCKTNNINLIIESVDVNKDAKTKHKSIEQSARDLRYQTFKKIKKQLNVNKLFLAHHQNDLAETVLFNIVRGTGVDGAIGIKTTNEICRPFLSFSKAQILEFIKNENLQSVEDSSNLISNTSRNLIRNEVTPMLEKICDKATSNIANFAECLAEDEGYFQSILPLNLTKVEKNKIEIDLSVLSLHRAISIRTIKHCLKQNNWAVDVFRVNFEQILGLKNSQNGAKINLPHETCAYREYDKIVIMKDEKNEFSEFENINLPNEEWKNPQAEFKFKLGSFEIFDNKFNIEKAKREDVVLTGADKFADFDKIPQRAVLRTRRNGDIFVKFGGGTKKLNDVLIDLKIPSRVRDTVVVLADDNEVLWINGFDISSKIKIDNTTKNIIKFESKIN